MVSNSGTTFFTCFLCCVGFGVIVFALWDQYEHSTFNMNREELEKNKNDIEIPEFTLRDAFTTSGVTGQSMVSFSRRSGRNKVQAPASPRAQETSATTPGEQEGTRRRRQSVWERVNQPVDLLQDNENSVIYIQALLKHHPMLRMFTYGSLRVTRVLRFVTFCTDILLLIYVTTLFYATAFPNNNGCTSYRKYEVCIAKDSNWIDGATLCSWDWVRLKCSLRYPTQTMKYFAIVGSVVLLVSIVPLALIKWAFEYVYTKQIGIALRTFTAGIEESRKRKEELRSVHPADISSGRDSPAGMMRNMSKMMPRMSVTPDVAQMMRRNMSSRLNITREEKEARAREKEERAREREARARELQMKMVLEQAMNQMDVDERERNRVVMQHFVEENLAAHEAFFVRGHFFSLDHAKPETVGAFGVLLWVFTMASTLALWAYFVEYIYTWLDNTNPLIVSAWITTFLSSWALKVFAFDFLGVFLVYVLPLVFLRDKLRDIYDIISGASAPVVNEKPEAKAEEGRAKVKFEESPRRVRRDSVTAQVAAQLSTQGKATDAAAMIARLDPDATSKLMEVKSRRTSMSQGGGRRLSMAGAKSPSKLTLKTMKNTQVGPALSPGVGAGAGGNTMESALLAARQAVQVAQTEDLRSGRVASNSPLHSSSAPKGRKIMF